MRYNFGAGLFLVVLIAIFFLAPIVFVLVAIGVLVHAAFKSDTTPKQPLPRATTATQQSTSTHSRPIRGNRLMSSTERNAYLLSPQWKALRKLVIARDKCCQLTGDVTNLEVHHIHYDNLSNEYLEDLVLLSRRAHQFVHDYYGSYDRYNTYPITEELRTAYVLSLLNNP